MATNLIFFHGWGFDSSFWLPLVRLITKDNAAYNIINVDYGYFGPAKMPVQPHDGNWIAIVHSLGLIKMIDLTRLQGCVAIVNCAGFLNFAGYGHALNTMIAKLSQNAPALLADFYKNCGLPKAPQPDYSAINIGKLTKDLRHLRFANFERADLQLPMLSLYTADDVIIKPKHRVFANNPNHSNVILKTGGHAAIFSNPTQFYPAIRDFLLTLNQTNEKQNI